MPNDLRRLYIDASVFYGLEGAQTATHSKAFFEQVLPRQYDLVTSALVAESIRAANNERITSTWHRALAASRIADIDTSVLGLARQYQDAGIAEDTEWFAALNMAIAVMARCDYVVTWDFRGILNVDKQHAYAGFNALMGQAKVAISSPQEWLCFDLARNETL